MSELILYIDMDGVLVDFQGGIAKLSLLDQQLYNGRYEEYTGFFSLLEPIPGALEAFRVLSDHFDVYILSCPSIDGPSSWTDKFLWVKRYLPYAKHKLILTRHKNLNKGAYLIDDRTKHGASEFDGTFIHFGTTLYPNWSVVLDEFNLKT